MAIQNLQQAQALAADVAITIKKERGKEWYQQNEERILTALCSFAAGNQTKDDFLADVDANDKPLVSIILDLCPGFESIEKPATAEKIVEAMKPIRPIKMNEGRNNVHLHDLCLYYFENLEPENQKKIWTALPNVDWKNFFMAYSDLAIEGNTRSIDDYVNNTDRAEPKRLMELVGLEWQPMEEKESVLPPPGLKKIDDEISRITGSDAERKKLRSEPRKQISEDNTYLTPEEVYLFNLLLLKKMGAVDCFPETVKFEANKRLYITKDYKKPEFPQDGLALVLRDAYKAHISETLEKKGEFSEIIALSGTKNDELESVHFAAAKFKKTPDGKMEITLHETLLSSLGEEEIKRDHEGNEEYFKSRFEDILPDEYKDKVTVHLPTIGMQGAANCGFHAAVESIALEYGLGAPEKFGESVQSFRQGFKSLYETGNIAQLDASVEKFCVDNKFSIPHKSEKSKEQEVPKPDSKPKRVSAFKQEISSQRGSFLPSDAIFGKLEFPLSVEEIKAEEEIRTKENVKTDLDTLITNDKTNGTHLKDISEAVFSYIYENKHFEPKEFFEIIQPELDMLKNRENNLSRNVEREIYYSHVFEPHLHLGIWPLRQAFDLVGAERLNSFKNNEDKRKFLHQVALMYVEKGVEIQNYFSDKNNSCVNFSHKYEREIERIYEVRGYSPSGRKSLQAALNEVSEKYLEAWLQDDEVTDILKELIKFNEYKPKEPGYAGIGDGFILTEGATPATYPLILEKALEAASSSPKPITKIYIPYVVDLHWVVHEVDYEKGMTVDNVERKVVDSFKTGHQGDAKSCGDWCIAYITNEINRDHPGSIRKPDASEVKKIIQLYSDDPRVNDNITKRVGGMGLRDRTKEIYQRPQAWVQKIKTEIPGLDNKVDASLSSLYKSHFRTIEKHEEQIKIILSDKDNAVEELKKYRKYLDTRKSIENSNKSEEDKRFLLDCLIVKCMQDGTFSDALRNLFLTNDRGFFNLFDKNINKLDENLLTDGDIHKYWQAADLLYRMCPGKDFSAEDKIFLEELMTLGIDLIKPSSDDIEKIIQLAENFPAIKSDLKFTDVEDERDIKIDSVDEEKKVKEVPEHITAKAIQMPDNFPQMLREFMNAGKVSDGQLSLKINHNEIISCSHQVSITDVKEIDALVQYFVGEGAKSIGTLETPVVEGTIAEGKARVHVTRFDVTQDRAGASEKTVISSVVAVDRVITKEDGTKVQQTSVYAVPARLQQSDEAQKLLIAATTLSNYILSLPLEDRKNPVIDVSDVHRDTPVMLLAMMRVFADKNGYTLKFVDPAVEKKVMAKKGEAETAYKQVVERGVDKAASPMFSLLGPGVSSSPKVPEEKIKPDAASEFVRKFGPGPGPV